MVEMILAFIKITNGRRIILRKFIILLMAIILLGGITYVLRGVLMTEKDKRIDYIELPATNIGEVKDFYGEVFGWTFVDYGPEYTSFNDGRLDGGFRKEPEVRRGGPLVVIYSIDLELVKEKVERAGGTIVKDIFEFPGGRRFHFTDPSGNELAIWSDK
jgi:predicted enzyme related to lactoylglutathione lyase